jgi:hypothetical protein
MKKKSISINDVRIWYANRITESWTWLDSAQSLFKTAELIEPHIHSLWDSINNDLTNKNEKWGAKLIEVANFQSVYMMLIAYCIENLLKGYIIECDRERIHRETLQTGKLPKGVKSHNLPALAKKCNLKLTELENNLLRRLSEHAIWFGRYPFSSSAPYYLVFKKPPKPTIDTGWSLEQAIAVKTLAESIAKQFGKNIRRKKVFD